MSTKSLTFTQFTTMLDQPDTLLVTWKWSREHTKGYKVKWTYCTGDRRDDKDKTLVWFVGNSGETTQKMSTFQIPANALQVKVYVKPIPTNKKYWSKKYKEPTQFIYPWSAKNTAPSVLPAPNVEYSNGKIRAWYDNLPMRGYWSDPAHVTFGIVADHSVENVVALIKADTVNAHLNPQLGHVEATYSVSNGHSYNVRAKAYGVSYVESDWSEWSETIETPPVSPEKILSIKTESNTSIIIDWTKVQNATGYEIQYSTKFEYFDMIDLPSVIFDNPPIDPPKIINQLQQGERYFFRIRAKNSVGDSEWSAADPDASIVLGKKPDPPTTWSSLTNVMVGDDLYLYWVHNSRDGSSQSKAKILLTVDGIPQEPIVVINDRPEDEKDKTSVYKLDTSQYGLGTTILWKVVTAGVAVDSEGELEYSDPSVERRIEVHAPATLALNVLGINDGVFSAYPIVVTAEAGPNSQRVMGYHVSIIANNAYTGVEDTGDEAYVAAGQEIYSKWIDTYDTSLNLEIMPGDSILENTQSYTLICTSSMDSGLSASQSLDFVVEYEDSDLEPDAGIIIDQDTLAAYIHPYCLVETDDEEDSDELMPNVVLDVYRREYDGTLLLIQDNVPNTEGHYICDPHPALDFARYRIVARSTVTGAIDFYDVPGQEVGEKAIVLQWGGSWTDFEYGDDEAIIDKPAYSGNVLKLLYNVDVSMNNTADVALVEYIGRKHPVSYYGTQMGVSASWNTEIPATDTDTLYEIRRLQSWMGDVYVREPSGTGYWANIAISYNKNHTELTIPISIELKRVEGGI